MKTYDPKEVSVIIGGHIVAGYADGTFVSVERDNDGFTYNPSTSGGGTRTKSASKSGKITVTLQQSSESNEFFSKLADADEKDGSGVVPAMIRDNSGKDLHKTSACYLIKRPKADYGKELQNREWAFQCDNLEMYLGGN